MGFHDLELSPISCTLVTLAALAAAGAGKVGLGMLRAYYILRVRAGLPVVLWYPKFWRLDSRRQKGSSLSRVLKRMELLEGPHGMYGTVFGTQAVVHVADPEAAALVLTQHTKRPGYDHFGNFFGRGVFTADGEEWRKKRSTVAHTLFRGSTANHPGGGGVSVAGGGKALAVLANEEADSLLAEVEALRKEGGEVDVEIVRLLQRHTLNLIHRFLCGGEDVCSSPERKRRLSRYLDAVTDMRMVILARSRSVWMFAWGWVYRAFSPFYSREAQNMVQIRAFAELVLDTAVARGGNAPPRLGPCTGNGSHRRDVAGGYSTHNSVTSSDSNGGNSDGSSKAGSSISPSRSSVAIRRDAGAEGTVGGEANSPQLSEEGGSGARGTAGRSAMDEILRTEGGARLREEKPRNALLNMAERESHRTYPGSMVDETITLLFAGQDTSAATLSWTMHLLSLPENRVYLLEVRREVLAAVGGPDGYVDCADGDGGGGSPAPAVLDKNDKHQSKRRPVFLHMVDACIRESQRLYPVAPFVVRHLASDLRLKDGTLLPAGALACVWIYGLHRHPALWESPDTFLPRRWLNGARQPAGAFIPYASGPRGCVGRPFANVALRILLARMCLAFHFSPTAAADDDASDTVPLTATAGIPTVEAAGVADTEPPTDGTECFPEKEKFLEKHDVLPGGGAGIGHAVGGFSGESGGGRVAEGRDDRRCLSKEMQAGFTVLPAGGVHLRLRKWEE